MFPSWHNPPQNNHKEELTKLAVRDEGQGAGRAVSETYQPDRRDCGHRATQRNDSPAWAFSKCFPSAAAAGSAVICRPISISCHAV